MFAVANLIAVVGPNATAHDALQKSLVEATASSPHRSGISSMQTPSH